MTRVAVAGGPVVEVSHWVTAVAVVAAAVGRTRRAYSYRSEPYAARDEQRSVQTSLRQVVVSRPL